MSKIYQKKCKWCGSPFESETRGKKICPACDSVKRAKEEERKRQRQKPDKLGDLQREIDTYNREHGTALTYGQYVLKFGK